MSTFFYPITVAGPNGQVTIDALVDTGATFTSLPAATLLSLGIQPQRQVRLRSRGDGSTQVVNIGYATAELADVKGETQVVFDADESPPSIGIVTLQAFLLGVNPSAQELVPVEGWQLHR